MASIEYIEGNTAVHRMNALTKLSLLLVVFVVALLFSDIISMSVLLAFVLCWWAVARISMARFKNILLVTLSVIVIFLVVQGFFYFRGKTTIFVLPYFNAPFHLEGLLLGLSMGFRILSVVCTVPVLTTTTPISQILRGLAKARVPYKFNFILSTALRFTPLIYSVYFEIVDAQKLRAHDIDKMGYVEKIRKAFIPVVTPMVLSLLRRSDDLEISIESRAFGAAVKRTFLEKATLGRVDFVALSILAIFLTVCVVDRIMYGFLIPAQLLPEYLRLAYA